MLTIKPNHCEELLYQMLMLQHEDDNHPLAPEMEHFQNPRVIVKTDLGFEMTYCLSELPERYEFERVVAALYTQDDDINWKIELQPA